MKTESPPRASRLPISQTEPQGASPGYSQSLAKRPPPGSRVKAFVCATPISGPAVADAAEPGRGATSAPAGGSRAPALRGLTRLAPACAPARAASRGPLSCAIGVWVGESSGSGSLSPVPSRSWNPFSGISIRMGPPRAGLSVAGRRGRQLGFVWMPGT